MATLPVYDRTGAKVGDYEIDPAGLAAQINKQLLHDAVVMYQANLRLGTHKTKTRGEVAGSTRKMYRQKGTGNARAGSRRSGVRVGGGHIHAKRPRDYSYRLPRKALQLATRMAMASRIQDDELTIIDDLGISAPKTKEMAQILKALNLDGATVLVATDGYDVNIYRSGRNIAGVSVAPYQELNALSLLKPRKVLITKSALENFCQKCSGAKSEEPAEAAS